MESFHHYFIETVKCIGKGGFGIVEEVNVFNFSKSHKTAYARKLLSNSDFNVRFAREVKHQASCIHDNIVPIVLHNLNVTRPWFIMPLAECSLDKELQSNVLDRTKKIEIFTMVIEAVIYIHDKGLLHRDIKPQNILKYSDVYKLADFGLVKNIHPSENSEKLTAIGQQMGTPGYMSPEILEGGHYSKSSDIYAIGILLKHLSLGDDFDEVIENATKIKPSRRYQETKDMKKAFLDAISQTERR